MFYLETYHIENLQLYMLCDVSVQKAMLIIGITVHPKVGHVLSDRIFSEEGKKILLILITYCSAVHYSMATQDGKLVHELTAKYEKDFPSS
jgi:hypothetical protein